jgi:hypothetical protein
VARTVTGEKAMPRRRDALSKSDPELAGRKRPECAEQGARGSSHLTSKRYGRGQDGGVHRGRGEQLQKSGESRLQGTRNFWDEVPQPSPGGAGGEHVGPRILLDDIGDRRSSREAVGLGAQALLGRKGASVGLVWLHAPSPASFLPETTIPQAER